MLREKERGERGRERGEKNRDWPRVSGENSSSHPQIICGQVSITGRGHATKRIKSSAPAITSSEMEQWGDRSRGGKER